MHHGGDFWSRSAKFGPRSSHVSTTSSDVWPSSATSCSTSARWPCYSGACTASKMRWTTESITASVANGVST